MNKQIKQQWIDALLSGKYKQTTGVLRNKDGFCCLGVLCDIVDKEAWAWSDTYHSYIHKNGPGVLPVGVIKSAELSGHSATIRLSVDTKDAEEYGLGDRPALSELNDAGVSFEDIAKIIEKYL